MANREFILCAAIWVNTGRQEQRRSYTYPETGLLFCGWRHGDCFPSLNAWADLLPPEERIRIGEDQVAGRHQGFLTSKGRFANRDEALAIAWKAKQTNKRSGQLFSEDLY